MAKRRFLAITGIVAGGKSHVCQYLDQHYGIQVLNVDWLVAQAFHSQAVHKLLAPAFNYQPYTKADLRTCVLHGEDPIRGLTAEFRTEYITLMNQEVARLYDGVYAQRQFVEFPLLFEQRQQKEFQHIWCVGCAPEIQRQRLYRRLETSQQTALAVPNDLKATVESFIHAQKSLEYKKKRSDWFLDTTDNGWEQLVKDQMDHWGFSYRA